MVIDVQKSNVSKMVEDRAKVTINCVYKGHA